MNTMLAKTANRKVAFLTAVIFLSYGVLASLPDLRVLVPEMLGLTAWITILLAAAGFCGRNQKPQLPIGFVIGGAALLRLLFLWRSPMLSDDIYRYVLDGLVTLSGHNPYELAPSAAVFAYPSLADWAARVNHPGFSTIYPPAAQVVFAAGAVLGGVTGMKCLLVALDLGTCALLLRLLDRMGRPRSLGLLYAWHPLAVIEIAGSGHIDAAGLFFFLLAVLLMARAPAGVLRSHPSRGAARFALAGAAMAAAVFIKLFPLLFLPGMWLYAEKHRRRWFAAGLAAAAAALVLPFWPEVIHMGTTLAAYLQRWEFSGFFFRMLRQAFGEGRSVRLFLSGIFLAAALALYLRMLRQRLRSAHGPDLPSLFQALYGISFAYLLTTPTLHPWYALYLAVFLPFAGGSAGLVFTWSVLLGYRVLIPYALTGQWIESDLSALLIVAAPAAAMTVKGFITAVSPSEAKKTRAEIENGTGGTHFIKSVVSPFFIR